MAEERTGVSVTEAAAALGITPEAVRKRLARGTLPGHRVGRTWRVHLDEVSGPGGHSPHAGSQPREDATALVTALQEEVEWLRAEVIRKDSIIMSLSQRVPMLPSGQSAEATDAPAREAPATDRPHAPWWQFWRRD